MKRAWAWLKWVIATFIDPYMKAALIVGILLSLALTIPRTLQVWHHPSLFGAAAVVVAVLFEGAALRWAIRTPRSEIHVREGVLVSLYRIAIVLLLVFAVDLPAAYPTMRQQILAAMPKGSALDNQDTEFELPADFDGIVTLAIQAVQGKYHPMLDDVDLLVNGQLPAASRAALCPPVVARIEAAEISRFPLLVTTEELPLAAVCDDAAGRGPKAASEYLAIAHGSLRSAIVSAAAQDAGNAFAVLAPQLPGLQVSRECFLASRLAYMTEVHRQCTILHIPFRHTPRSRVKPALPSESA